MLQSADVIRIEAMGLLVALVPSRELLPEALGLLIGISLLEWCAIVIAIVMVWMAEALNTAFEFLCDAASPEYHPLIEDEEAALDRDFLPEGGESNPFLHLGMHISLQEQIGSDRPAGITALYRQMVLKTGDSHQAEHRLMECLGRMLWEAQRAQRLPDEQAYLECVRSILKII